jgi:hypothetical protein
MTTLLIWWRMIWSCCCLSIQQYFFWDRHPYWWAAIVVVLSLDLWHQRECDGGSDGGRKGHGGGRYHHTKIVWFWCEDRSEWAIASFLTRGFF